MNKYLHFANSPLLLESCYFAEREICKKCTYFNYKKSIVINCIYSKSHGKSLFLNLKKLPQRRVSAHRGTWAAWQTA